MKRGLAHTAWRLVLALATTATSTNPATATAAQAQVNTNTTQLTATTQEPRAYGYQVGDVVTRNSTVWVPTGLQLDTASLPTAGRQGHRFELRRVLWQPTHSTSTQTSYQLLLEYQVFLSPPAVRTLELPPVTLRFTGKPRAQDLRIDAWPVTVAPLVPVDVSSRRGLGELQPDAEPPLLDTRPATTRLLVYAAVAAVLAFWLLHIYGVMPWLARRQRPFEKAWRQLSALPADGSAQTQRVALQTLHQALNHSAGRVLFEQGLPDFLAAQPRYAPLQADLLQFFKLSRSTFFEAGSASATPAPAAFLTTLGRRCRDAESGRA